MRREDEAIFERIEEVRQCAEKIKRDGCAKRLDDLKLLEGVKKDLEKVEKELKEEHKDIWSQINSMKEKGFWFVVLILMNVLTIAVNVIITIIKR